MDLSYIYSLLTHGLGFPQSQTLYLAKKIKGKQKTKQELRDKTLIINEGDFIIIPKGVEHRPVAENEAEVMLFEPATTLNTGDKRDALTKDKLERI